MSLLSRISRRIESQFLSKFEPFFGDVPSAGSGTYGFYADDHWVLFTNARVDGQTKLLLMVCKAVEPGKYVAELIYQTHHVDLEMAFVEFIHLMATYTPTASARFWAEASRRASVATYELPRVAGDFAVKASDAEDDYRRETRAERLDRIDAMVSKLAQPYRKDFSRFYPTIPVPLTAPLIDTASVTG